jgi:integrase
MTGTGLSARTCRQLVLVQAYCGLRTGEARALRWRDFNDNHTITIRASASKVNGRGYVEGDTKTHRTRWVPVPGPVWRVLTGEQAVTPNGRVLAGKSITPDDVKRATTPHYRAAAIEHEK